MYMYTSSINNHPRNHRKSLRQDPKSHLKEKARFSVPLYSISYRWARYFDQPGRKYIGFILFGSHLIASLLCLIKSWNTLSEERPNKAANPISILEYQRRFNVYKLREFLTFL